MFKNKIFLSIVSFIVFFSFLNINLAFGICPEPMALKGKNPHSTCGEIDAKTGRQVGSICTRCKNGSRRGNLTKEPVLLQNGNLQLTNQDINIPGKGLSLDITRIYNAQLSSNVDGWAPEDGSGSWSIENMEYSGDGGEVFSKYSYQDAVIEANVKTVTPGEFDFEMGAIYFRYDSNYYYFLIHTDGRLELGKGYTSLVQKPSNYNPLEWNHIKIVTTGNLIEIYVNNNLEISYSDPSPLISGRVVLLAIDSHAHFDNVSVNDNSTIIQSNDFTDNANGWTPEQNPENWLLEQEEYSGLNGRSVSDASSLNTTVNIQMKTVATGAAVDDVGWINFRYQNPNNRYYFYITEDKQLVLGRFKSGVQTVLSQATNLSYDPLFWNNIKISAIKGEIRVWINEILVAQTVDNDPLPEGKIALEAKNSHVHFDNVSIRNGTPALANDFNSPDLENNTAFGNGWTFNYETKIFADPLSGSITIRGADGAKEQYVKKSDGSFAPPKGIYSQLTKTETSYTLREKNGTIQTFDLNGNLISIKDRNNNQITISYVDVGGIQRPQNITDASGRKISLEYNANGKISKVIYPAPEAPGHREINYIYDGNNLIEADYPSGYKKLYTYYPLTVNLHTYTDPNNYTTTYNYSYSDKVLEEIDPDGQITTFFYSKYATSVKNSRDEHTTYEFGYADSLLTSVQDTFYNYEFSTYDDNNNLISFDDKNGHTTDYEYDSQGNRTRIIKHLSGHPDIVTNFTYEPTFNQATSITDPKANTTQFQYDPANGNLLKIIDPAPFLYETNMAYDEFGNLRTVTDARANTTEYGYDQYGNRSQIIEAKNVLNYTTNFTYDILSQLTSTTDANQHPTTYEYDQAGNLIKTTDSLANITQYSYDGDANRLTETRYLNNNPVTTRYEYDWANNLIRQINPDNTTTTYTYDLANFLHLGVANRLTVTDVNQKTTTYEYDSENRLIKVTDPKNNFTQYGYDDVGNITSTTDANQNNLSYEYDDLNRLTYVYYPDTTYEELAYDGNGNLLTKRKQNGDTINYAYDNLNRMASKTYPDQTSVTYQYDPVDNLINVTDATGTIANTYNEVNRLTQVNYPSGYSVSYEYDPVGNRSKLTYPSNFALDYAYDQINRLTRIEERGARIATYLYDTLSRRKQIRLANKTAADYQYDIKSQLKQVANYKLPTLPQNLFSMLRGLFVARNAEAIEQIALPLNTFSFYHYNLDAVGNRKLLRSQIGNETYNYDSINQVIGVSGLQQHSYQYDPVGNRQIADGVNYSVNNLSQYTVVGAQNYSYDLNGNLTNDGVFAYTYDYENRLITALGNGRNASYAYDPFGRRISKTVDGVTTNFIYDADRIIEERNSDGSLEAKYIYGEGIDEVLRMDRFGSNYYYHYDGLGSVTDITNIQGDIVESFSYDVYGLPNQTSQIGNTRYFTGREFDEETGLYYYRARYYSPAIGRFLQKDPLTWTPSDARVSYKDDIVSDFNKNLLKTRGTFDAQSLHNYSYVNNNPINYTDPKGLYKSKSWNWLQKMNLYLTEVGEVMVTKYPYTLNMQGLLGVTQNAASAASMVGYMPKSIGYSDTDFLQGGRIAYRWANQYGEGAKFMTFAKMGVISSGLSVVSAITTGYTIGATINSYYWGYLNYKQKYGGK